MHGKYDKPIWGGIPVNVGATWKGLSFDFKLGRLYQMVASDVVSEMHESATVGREHARKRYRDGNCAVMR